MSNCNSCNGQGTIDCPVCNCAGVIPDREGDLVTCKECNGKGNCCCPHCDDGTPRNVSYPGL